MFARFDEIPAMTFKVLRKQNFTDNVKTEYPPQAKFEGGIEIVFAILPDYGRCAK